MVNKMVRNNVFLVLMLFVGVFALSACGEVAEVDEETAIEEEIVEEEILEEEEVVEEEPVVEEEIVEEEPVVEEEVVEEEPVMEEEAVVEEEPMVEEEAMAEEGMMEVTDTFPIRAAELLGDDVMNMANEDLGEVEEIVLGLNSQVDYAIVSFEEGFLDFGVDEMTAIPLTALQPVPEDDAFQFLGDETTLLQDAPIFTEDAWGDLTDPIWDDAFFDFWSAQEMVTMPEAGDEAMLGPAFIRASELLEQEVWNAVGEDIGDVEEVVLQAQPDASDFAVMSFDEGLFDFDLTPDQLYAVPVSQLNFVVEGDNMFTFDYDPTLLMEAPSFTVETWPEVTDPLWDEGYSRYWEEAPLE